LTCDKLLTQGEKATIDEIVVQDIERFGKMNQYTAVVKQDGDWWVGWIEEIPGVNCQEQSREELLETLRITLQEAIEMNRQDAVAAAADGYEKAIVDL